MVVNDMDEHPFAPFIRILGKGPRLSRSLTRQEAADAATMVLARKVEPQQLGAFLCLLRVRTETPAEIAGFAQAIQKSLSLPVQKPTIELDWPSYAGKSRRLPLFILAALLLAENGISILMHGAEPHTQGRLYTEAALSALGIAPASSVNEAITQIKTRNFAYLPLKTLNPLLEEIMGLKTLLGLRSPLHSVLRNLNPLQAKASLMSVFHPNYRALHCEAGQLMGQGNLACFKGDGGEAERRVEKPCLVEGLRDGQAFREEWPALLDAAPMAETDLDPGQLARIWQGEICDPYGEAVIAATAAVALHLVGRSSSIGDADALAKRMWQDRKATALLAKSQRPAFY